MKKRLRNFYTKHLIEAGCDEAGRGCLAGPVYAAAVILPPKFCHPLLNDSKKITHQEREKLRTLIEKKALAWAVATVDHAEIDRINILNASFLAMHRAIAQLKLQPQQLLIDGNRFTPYRDIPHQCIVKGDAKFKNIAAASILAKTHRDEFMLKMSKTFPQYKWEKNKGYPTKDHVEALEIFGTSPLHRQTFTYKNKQFKLGF